MENWIKFELNLFLKNAPMTIFLKWRSMVERKCWLALIKGPFDILRGQNNDRSSFEPLKSGRCYSNAATMAAFGCNSFRKKNDLHRRHWAEHDAIFVGTRWWIVGVNTEMETKNSKVMNIHVTDVCYRPLPSH